MRNSARILGTLIVATFVASLTGGCTAKMKEARHLARADKYFNSGQYPRAEIEYLNVLRFDSKNTRAISRLGSIYYEQGRFGRAYPFLLAASELATNDVELHFKLGTIYLAVRKTKEAREQANLVLDNIPTHAEAPTLLAESVTTKKEAEEVRQRLDKLAAQVGDTAPVVLALGALQFHLGELKAAETAFKRAQEIDPKSSAASFALGNLLWAQNDLKGAESALKIAADLSPPRSPRRLSYADFKIRNGELEDGKRLLKDLNKEAPDYLPAWVRQAQIALAEKNYTNCASLLNQALARDPGNYDAMLLQGRMFLAQGDPTKAIAEFQRMAAMYERSAQVHYFLGLAHSFNKDANKALKSLNQAVALDPNFPDAILALAELNIRKGNPSAAIPGLTQLVKQRPQIPQAHLLLASAYLTQKNLNDALAVYSRMLTLFPKSPHVPLLMGIVLAQQNKPADARKAFEKSLELAPDFPIAVEPLVDLDIGEKQYAAALDRVQKLLEKAPTSASPHLLLARVHMARAMNYAQEQAGKIPGASRTNLPLSEVPSAQTDVNQAEAALLRAIELEPNFQPPYLLLSQLYVAANKHRQALDRLNVLVARTNNVAAWMQIGMIQDELKNFSAARDAYEKLLAINPNFTPALNNLAYVYSERLDRPDRAYELADKARQLLPADPFTADTLGWILYRRGEYNRAIGLITESAAAMPAEPEIQFHLGMTYYMLGDEQGARLSLQNALQGTKDFRGKDEASRRLAVLAIDIQTADASAVADLEKRLLAEPDDLVAMTRLAAIYERQGAVENAFKTYERALKRNPQNAQLMGRLAELYASRLNNPQKALALAKDAHGLAPDDARISHTLGRLAFQSGDYKWAISLLDESARKLPAEPDVLYDFAWACYSVGRVTDAEAAMQSVLQAANSFARTDEAKRFLAMVAASRSATQAAEVASEAQKILKADPAYVPALVVSAVLQEQQRHYKEAATLYDQILARYPSFTPATRSLAILSVEHLADDQNTCTLALKAREAYPSDPDVARALGIALYRRGRPEDYPRSVQLLRESASNRKGDADLLYYLGMGHYKLKQRSESKQALQQALALNVESKFAEEAKRTLASLK